MTGSGFSIFVETTISKAVTFQGWEGPADGRKSWRKKKPGGGWQYSKTPPKGYTPKPVEEEKSSVSGFQVIPQQSPMGGYEGQSGTFKAKMEEMHAAASKEIAEGKTPEAKAIHKLCSFTPKISEVTGKTEKPEPAEYPPAKVKVQQAAKKKQKEAQDQLAFEQQMEEQGIGGLEGAGSPLAPVSGNPFEVKTKVDQKSPLAPVSGGSPFDEKTVVSDTKPDLPDPEGATFGQLHDYFPDLATKPGEEPSPQQAMKRSPKEVAQSSAEDAFFQSTGAQPTKQPAQGQGTPTSQPKPSVQVNMPSEPEGGAQAPKKPPVVAGMGGVGGGSEKAQAASKKAKRHIPNKRSAQPREPKKQRTGPLPGEEPQQKQQPEKPKQDKPKVDPELVTQASDHAARVAFDLYKKERGTGFGLAMATILGVAAGAMSAPLAMAALAVYAGYKFGNVWGRATARFPMSKGFTVLRKGEDENTQKLKQAFVDSAFNITPDDVKILRGFMKPDGKVDLEGLKEHFAQQYEQAE